MGHCDNVDVLYIPMPWTNCNERVVFALFNLSMRQIGSQMRASGLHDVHLDDPSIGCSADCASLVFEGRSKFEEKERAVL